MFLDEIEDRFQFEKITIYMALKEKYFKILLNEHHIRFNKMLNEFWQLNLENFTCDNRGYGVSFS